MVRLIVSSERCASVVDDEVIDTSASPGRPASPHRARSPMKEKHSTLGGDRSSSLVNLMPVSPVKPIIQYPPRGITNESSILTPTDRLTDLLTKFDSPGKEGNTVYRLKPVKDASKRACTLEGNTMTEQELSPATKKPTKPKRPIRGKISKSQKEEKKVEEPQSSTQKIDKFENFEAWLNLAANPKNDNKIGDSKVSPNQARDSTSIVNISTERPGTRLPKSPGNQLLSRISLWKKKKVKQSNDKAPSESVSVSLKIDNGSKGSGKGYQAGATKDSNPKQEDATINEQRTLPEKIDDCRNAARLKKANGVDLPLSTSGSHTQKASSSNAKAIDEPHKLSVRSDSVNVGKDSKADRTTGTIFSQKGSTNPSVSTSPSQPAVASCIKVGTLSPGAKKSDASWIRNQSTDAQVFSAKEERLKQKLNHIRQILKKSGHCTTFPQEEVEGCSAPCDGGTPRRIRPEERSIEVVLEECTRSGLCQKMVLSESGFYLFHRIPEFSGQEIAEEQRDDFSSCQTSAEPYERSKPKVTPFKQQDLSSFLNVDEKSTREMRYLSRFLRARKKNITTCPSSESDGHPYPGISHQSFSFATTSSSDSGHSTSSTSDNFSFKKGLKWIYEEVLVEGAHEDSSSSSGSGDEDLHCGSSGSDSEPIEEVSTVETDTVHSDLSSNSEESQSSQYDAYSASCYDDSDIDEAGNRQLSTGKEYDAAYAAEKLFSLATELEVDPNMLLSILEAGEDLSEMIRPRMRHYPKRRRRRVHNGRE